MGVRYTAEVSFLEKSPRYETEKPYLVLLPEGAAVDPSIPLHNLKFEEKEVSVLDIRDCQSAYHLDECGFEYLSHTTGVTAILGDQPTVDHVNAYKAETEALLRQRFGAVKVVCYELRLRERKDFVRDTFDINDPLLVEGPALGAHTGNICLHQSPTWADAAGPLPRRHGALRPRNDPKPLDQGGPRPIPHSRASFSYCQVGLWYSCPLATFLLHRQCGAWC
jgi:hypothetical protein